MRGASRRTLLAGGLALGALALTAGTSHAQSPGGRRRIGVLLGRAEDDPQGKEFAAALVEGLGALGWHEGGNLAVDWRWAGGDPALYPRYAAELVAAVPEVLVANGSPAVEALRHRAGTIPIVFITVTDPVGQGFVASLAHPGGTITGFSDYDPPMAGKWLQMLTQITPPVAHVAVLYNPDTSPFAGPVMRAFQDAAPSFGVTVRPALLHAAGEIDGVMAGLAREAGAGVVVLGEVFTASHGDAIIAAARRHRLPAVFSDKVTAASGALMSYGPDTADLFRRSAAYVDRLLKGAQAADLPVQNPTKFELAVNLKTASEIGVAFSATLFAAADEVIE